MGTGDAPAPARRLGRIVVAELTVLLVVVGVTAVLVARSPVTSSAAASGRDHATRCRRGPPLQRGRHGHAIAISPAQAGSNEIRVSHWSTQPGSRSRRSSPRRSS